MLLPRWVSVVAQPIGIEDLVSYLVASMDVRVTEVPSSKLAVQMLSHTGI